MSPEFNDLTGQPPSLADVREARQVVREAMIYMVKLPPMLAVNLANIDRCLAVAEDVIKKSEAST